MQGGADKLANSSHDSSTHVPTTSIEFPFESSIESAESINKNNMRKEIFETGKFLAEKHENAIPSKPNSQRSSVIDDFWSEKNQEKLGKGESQELPQPSLSQGMHQWKSKLNILKNSLLGSPRFHRRKVLTIPNEIRLTPESSPEFIKKSWFGNLITTEKDESFTILIKKKPLAVLKAELIHIFLSIADLSYSICSPMSFKLEYKRNCSGTMFQRQIRFQIDMNEISNSASEYIIAITFTLLTGNIRRFKRICDHIQSQISDESRKLDKEDMSNKKMIVSEKPEDELSVSLNDRYKIENQLLLSIPVIQKQTKMNQKTVQISKPKSLIDASIENVCSKLNSTEELELGRKPHISSSLEELAITKNNTDEA